MVPMLSLSITEGEDFFFSANLPHSVTHPLQRIKLQNCNSDLKIVGRGSDHLRSLSPFPEETVGLSNLAFQAERERLTVFSPLLSIVTKCQYIYLWAGEFLLNLGVLLLGSQQSSSELCTETWPLNEQASVTDCSGKMLLSLSLV